MSGFSIVLLEACNLDCVYCLRDNRFRINSEMPLLLVEEVLKAGARHGYEWLTITGGEPLLHSKFREIMVRVASLPFKVILETNGSLMTPEVAGLLVSLFGLERLQCMTSLDHCSAKKHDPFRGPGSFDRAVRSIHLLKGKGIYIHANRMVTPRNLISRDDALEHLDFCQSIGIDSVYFSRVVDIESKFSADLVLEPGAIKRTWEVLKDLRHPCFDLEANGSFLEYGWPDCPKMECNSFNVNAHGLSPCLFMPDVILGTHDQLDRLIAEEAFRRFAKVREKALAPALGGGPMGCSECSRACRQHFRHASGEVVHVEIN